MSTLEHSATHNPRTIDIPLPATGLLAACSRRELARIARRCDVVEVDSGACVQPGQPLHWVYIVLNGLVAVSCDGGAFVVGDSGAIGARSALTSGTPTVAIDALTSSTLVVMTRPEFLGLAGALRGLGTGAACYLAQATETL